MKQFLTPEEEKLTQYVYSGLTLDMIIKELERYEGSIVYWAGNWQHRYETHTYTTYGIMLEIGAHKSKFGGIWYYDITAHVEGLKGEALILGESRDKSSEVKSKYERIYRIASENSYSIYMTNNTKVNDNQFAEAKRTPRRGRLVIPEDMHKHQISNESYLIKSISPDDT